MIIFANSIIENLSKKKKKERKKERRYLNNFSALQHKRNKIE